MSWTFKEKIYWGEYDIYMTLLLKRAKRYARPFNEKAFETLSGNFILKTLNFLT